MTVVGCVWGAWRTLQDEQGAAAPSYAWCEQQWREHLHRAAPHPGKALPPWLTQALRLAWQRSGQLTLF